MKISKQLGLYNLILGKKYQKFENIYESILAVIYSRKMVNNFYKKYQKNPKSTFFFYKFCFI